ncbi:hypothetical protein IscW_ISCW001183 [Ixodes scapularis]|uniref:Uncharacterized protein n=1 Tax=Ixodes scapularis TaxID=6945 RepID=B7P3E2_IXOSC|nr:hypothetical protein IscW_ISCW001183 [Ixodes scapularis]|eukprot:XP_002404001.1 hypothetical protein IscW_ISCW001183 [Ixodes scapularis]
MKHDSWTVSKFRAWKKEQSQPPMAPSGPDKTPSSLVAAVDPAVDPAAVGKYKRSRYNDRKEMSD